MLQMRPRFQIRSGRERVEIANRKFSLLPKKSRSVFRESERERGREGEREGERERGIEGEKGREREPEGRKLDPKKQPKQNSPTRFG